MHLTAVAPTQIITPTIDLKLQSKADALKIVINSSFLDNRGCVAILCTCRTWQQLKPFHARVLFSIWVRNQLTNLPKVIETQRLQPTYKRTILIPVSNEHLNRPTPLTSPLKDIVHISKDAIFFPYSSEGIQDNGWGCAWRSIQTCLSPFKLPINTFEQLFHLFGSLNALNVIYQNKYPKSPALTSSDFVPHTSENGWAEPFIGEMILHFFHRPADLDTVNGISAKFKTPSVVFKNKTLDFKAFKAKLIIHFLDKGAPVVIDDGFWSFSIVGVSYKNPHLTLLIADAHVKEGVNPPNKVDKPVGLYTVVLNEKGGQIHNSVRNNDKDMRAKMSPNNGPEAIMFDVKPWMALFPKKNPKVEIQDQATSKK